MLEFIFSGVLEFHVFHNVANFCFSRLHHTIRRWDPERNRHCPPVPSYPLLSKAKAQRSFQVQLQQCDWGNAVREAV